jgi:hypothetical protein
MNSFEKHFPLADKTALKIVDRLDTIIAIRDDLIESKPELLAEELLKIGETILESWLDAKGIEPTEDKHEGFRLLALQRQGAKGDPSFNACRETCRELVYHYNCIVLDPHGGETNRRIRYAAMVARHLLLFIDGKLENAGLGEFCCSSRSLRQDTGLKHA